MSIMNRRSACYLLLLGILILASIRWELPRLRLPGVVQVLRYDYDDNDNEK